MGSKHETPDIAYEGFSLIDDEDPYQTVRRFFVIQNPTSEERIIFEGWLCDAENLDRAFEFMRNNVDSISEKIKPLDISSLKGIVEKTNIRPNESDTMALI